MAGLWIGSAESPQRKAIGLLIAGAAGIALGYVWNVVFPINKSLWTSSFVLFTAGAASVFLALCFWTIDIMRWKGWTKPFVILGMNAITLYVVSGLLAETLGLVTVTGSNGREMSLGRYFFAEFLAPIASPKNASLMYAFANLLVLFVLLAWMYRRRIFLRV